MAFSSLVILIFLYKEVYIELPVEKYLASYCLFHSLAGNELNTSIEEKEANERESAEQQGKLDEIARQYEKLKTLLDQKVICGQEEKTPGQHLNILQAAPQAFATEDGKRLRMFWSTSIGEKKLHCLVLGIL